MPRVLVFILYKYFPFGGLQRDFVRIAQACQETSGCKIVVLTMSWEGERPEGWQIEVAPQAAVRALTQVGRYKKFTRWVQGWIATAAAQTRDDDLAVVASRKPSLRAADRPRGHPLVIGFNKMPGLDFYYAADPCFAEKAQMLRGGYYKFTPRFKHFMEYEHAVFSHESKTQILMISETQMPFFQKHYGTPLNRIHMLPPGVSRDRMAPENAAELRQSFRKEFEIAPNDRLLLLLGSDFKRKGLDRILQAMAALPNDQRENTKLFVVGKDNPKPFEALAKSLGLNKQLKIFLGRNDAPRFLLGADLLLHPAYHENTGTVILEALAAGLPVITTANCGYAHYVEKANAGIVIAEPFRQQALNHALETARNSNLNSWGANALAFAKRADLYSMPERAAEVILQGWIATPVVRARNDSTPNSSLRAAARPRVNP